MEGKFVVATDDLGHPGVVLFMVDRTRQKKSFWSNQLTDSFLLNTKEGAEILAGTLKYNRPHVLSGSEAKVAEYNNLVIHNG